MWSTVKFLLAIPAVVLAAPVVLVVAVAFGPVILGILCALISGLVVFAVWSLLLGLGQFGRTLERSRNTRRARASHTNL